MALTPAKGFYHIAALSPWFWRTLVCDAFLTSPLNGQSGRTC